MSTPEAKVKAAIKKYLEGKGIWFAGRPTPQVVTGWMYMPVPMGMGVHGIPDFCGIYLGRPVYIEAKAPGGKPSENQIKRHEEIRRAGGIVVIADNVEAVQNAIEGISGAAMWSECKDG